ncbi:hypothetical protein SBD_4683 [Streptomyces bottropensis ATCC 25435]|uniref:Uncharacterized protein n=1 Tax=Streptomyces bottropensis ATCC 25435 TaxID=1054862 RepID=M3EFL1_9ACTN|nr:hypothetical protein SBD_4683 [Streptomyces bottropensis ATCC 25435]
MPTRPVSPVRPLPVRTAPVRPAPVRPVPPVLPPAPATIGARTDSLRVIHRLHPCGAVPAG